MYSDPALENELTYSHTIDSEQAVWVEWNLNQSHNIDRVGNYRFRPGSGDPLYGTVSAVYDPDDVDSNYTGATDSDTIINAGFDDNDYPAYFTTEKKKVNLLYSLDDCFKQNRPRSGINKLLYLGVSGAQYGSSQYIDGLTAGISSSTDPTRRPRYYMASRYDPFKYWTSYRTAVEDGVTREFGVGRTDGTGVSYYIYDAAPFVVYNDPVPANKITIKMQTNVGEVDNGPFRVGINDNVPDPLYGDANRTVPIRWAIQILNSDNQWIEAKAFDEGDLRGNGDQIIKSDGVVEITYGLTIPSGYEDVFTFVETIYSTSVLPDLAPYGYAYMYKESETDIGSLYVSDGSNWVVYAPEYTWSLYDNSITRNTNVVKRFVDPDYYLNGAEKVYREFEFVKGIRVVAETMNKINTTLDIIEISPRLVADVSDRIVSYQISKTLADLGNTSMPTGALLASTGSLALFDYDLSMNENNVFDYDTSTGSIISSYTNTKLKFFFYDIVKNIGNYDYYIPVKTMYTEKVPQMNGSSPAEVQMELRDAFHIIEAEKAPELLLTDVSMSYAITVLLDSIGFSNYNFLRVVGEDELIIPYFFVGPDSNVAEVLQDLAVSTQSAMFFNEYNDLVIMSKNYLLPEIGDRPTDMVLYGQETFDGVNTALPNVINLSSQEKRVMNGGDINYTTRYIQKSIGSIAQAPYIDEYKSYIYKPVLLWEVAGQQATKTINESAQTNSGYSLAAVPLKTSLTADIPTYNGTELMDNIIDLGEGVYWLGNYAGYLYSNGEVIKFDAVEYSVSGVGSVWIKNNQEYQSYFSRLRFNSKMYPTGRVRIYTNLQDAEIKEHGRGQFGTEIVEHLAGIPDSSPWVNDFNVKGSIQNAKEFLFNTNPVLSYPTNTGTGPAGDSVVINGQTFSADSYAIKSTRNGIIKNFMANTNITESEVNYYKTALAGSVQASALVFNGPVLPSEIEPADFISYAYKPLEKPFKHFGTRMRIIGRVEAGTNKDQSPIGAFDIYSADLTSDDPTKQISISGGSGGLAFGLNKDTNVGYYFEIAALSQNSISSYKNNSNVVSYTILSSPIVTCNNGLVTVSLSTQHDFEIGTKVTMSGLVDDNDKAAASTLLNGEYEVTSISVDRKLFQYDISNALTTTASTGGTVTKTVDENTLISDVFFYKVVSGPKEADIIKNARTGTEVTLTTLRDHSLVIGESIVVTGANAALNGTFIITDVTNRTIKYNTAASGTVTEADLSPLGLATSVNRLAIPEILWRGYTEIIVDDGKFTSQARLTDAEKTTTYDLSAEYLDIGTTRQFYLYINNKQIATVNDSAPLPQYNNMALFTRGTSRLMFENVYALSDNFAENSARALQLPISKVFGDELVTESDALRRYALSGIVQNTYLSGISSQGDPNYAIYYDEFGTIMREAAYFNIKYDRAYPALYAQLAQTINRVRGYTVSGFYAGSYGAEFLIFNAIDKNLNLDDTSGNYLRILGIAFTQDTSHTLKVDDFFKKNSNFTESLYNGTPNPEEYRRLYNDVLNSRNKYGRNDFVIDAPFVQTDAAAEDMMDWIIKKVIHPRRTIGVNTFATQHLQLGDIVEINYKDEDGLDIVAPTTTRFVVYNIEQNKSSEETTNTVFLAEV